MKTLIKNYIVVFLCSWLSFLPQGFAESSDRDTMNEVTRPNLLDWLQGHSSLDDNSSNDSPSEAVTNTSEKYSFQAGKRLAGGDRGGWTTACGVIQIGKPCRATKMSEKFVPYLLENMGKCVDVGLNAEGIHGGHKKVVAQHMGTYNNRAMRKGTKLSMHATGRSIDLSRLEITTSSGRQFNINMTKANGRKPFYKAFVDCWQKANRSRCGGKGLGHRAGALDCTFDPNHYTHVHLSMPFCPAKPGIASS